MGDGREILSHPDCLAASSPFAAAVTAALEEATRELASCRSPDRATQLVILVREAATSLATLRHILCDTL